MAWKKKSLFHPRITQHAQSLSYWVEKYTAGWKVFMALGREEYVVAAFVDENEAREYVRQKYERLVQS